MTSTALAVSTDTSAAPQAVDLADVRKRIGKIRAHLVGATLEREQQIELLLLGLVAQEHTVMVGPPGTAKSMLCDMVAECVDGTHMSHLMSKFTTPDEVFGGVDFKALQKDGLHKRNLKGNLADVEIAFLDEIFKSNGAMFDALLKILNEGKYRDQAHGEIKVPLRFVMGASNEYPDETNAAAYDRFVLRDRVHYITGTRNQIKLAKLKLSNVTVPTTPCQVTTAELDAVHAALSGIQIPDAVLTQLVKLRADLASDGIIVSDRRFCKALRVLQAAAWLEGETEVSVDDLSVLRFLWWDKPAEQDRLIALLGALDRSSTAKAIAEIDDALRAYANRPTDKAAYIEAIPDLTVRLRNVGKLTVQRMEDGEFSKRGKAKVGRRMVELREAFKALDADYKAMFVL